MADAEMIGLTMERRKHGKKIKAALALLTALLLGLLSACAQAKDVVLVGSTSVQPYAEVLAEEYHILYPGAAEVDVQGGGSATGIMAVRSGVADIGMSSRALHDDEKDLWSKVIAKDGLAIIVNPANPVAGLTLEQVRDIYAAKITDWSEVGGPAAKIDVVTREEGSGTRDAFKEKVMGKEAGITPRAIVQASNGAVRQVVSSDPHAIGFISLGLVDTTVKALSLDGVTASRENILNGSYGLYRPFLFVLSAPPEGKAKDFIDFVMSSEGQRILEQNGLISAVENPQ